MQNLERQLTFSVKGNSYKMEFPTVGQYIDIEARRMALSKGTYNDLLRSRLISSQKAMDLIDMVATTTVLCPALIKDLKADDLLKLDIFDAKELLTAYESNVKSWLDSWMKIFANALEPETESDKASDDVPSAGSDA